MRFSIGQLPVVGQAPGGVAAGDSRALQVVVDSNLAWEQSARMYSGAWLFLALLRTLLQEKLEAAWTLGSLALPLASSQRALVARLASVVSPQGQRAARQVWQLRVEPMQVLQAP
jgi:hypothetical protein